MTPAPAIQISPTSPGGTRRESTVQHVDGPAGQRAAYCQGFPRLSGHPVEGGRHRALGRAVVIHHLRLREDLDRATHRLDRQPLTTDHEQPQAGRRTGRRPPLRAQQPQGRGHQARHHVHVLAGDQVVQRRGDEFVSGSRDHGTATGEQRAEQVSYRGVERHRGHLQGDRIVGEVAQTDQSAQVGGGVPVLGPHGFRASGGAGGVGDVGEPVVRPSRGRGPRRTASAAAAFDHQPTGEGVERCRPAPDHGRPAGRRPRAAPGRPRRPRRSSGPGAAAEGRGRPAGTPPPPSTRRSSRRRGRHPAAAGRRRRPRRRRRVREGARRRCPLLRPGSRSKSAAVRRRRPRRPAGRLRPAGTARAGEAAPVMARAPAAPLPRPR